MPCRRPLTLAILLVAGAPACGDSSSSSGGGAPAPGSSGATAITTATPAGKFVEGTDYVVVERARYLDEMGFDRPVEAMSVLLPRGWKTSGGIRWKSTQACRAEMVRWEFTASSPDGAIRIDLLPARGFVWSSEPMIAESLRRASEVGGCQLSRPFQPAAYLQQFASRDLGGATVSDVQPDRSLNDSLARAGIPGSGIFATLAWPDGSQGLANIGVSTAVTRTPDYFTGMIIEQSVTSVFHQAFVRFPAARKDEALRVFRMALSSHRVNPVWKQAKDNFMTQLGATEHEIRLKTIRLMGEQAQAYAKAQSSAADERMRSWERQQASSDQRQRDTIQTIREVETWKDSTGNAVELSAGYHHGWSRPDGAYILTNNSLFDPAVALQQNWTRMERAQK